MPEQHRQVSAAAQRYRELYKTKVLLPDYTPFVCSSTEVRRRISEGIPTDGLLTPAVADYIRRHRLYETVAGKERGSVNE